MRKRVSSITSSAAPTSAITISIAAAIRPGPKAGGAATAGAALLRDRAGEAAGAGVFSVIGPPYRPRRFAQPYASPRFALDAARVFLATAPRPRAPGGKRTETRRVGKGCARTVRIRWSAIY